MERVPNRYGAPEAASRIRFETLGKLALPGVSRMYNGRHSGSKGKQGERMATASHGAKPSPERIFSTLTAFHQTEALKAAIRLDIFT